jgi:TonB-linked SusC/RagA family outer membrane protein
MSSLQAFRILRPFTFTVGLAAIVSWAASPVVAQNFGTVTGRVTNSAGQPLASAQVYLVGTGLGTLTAASGRYNVVNVPAGTYRVRVELIGNRTMEESVTVQANQSSTLDFTMREEALGLDQIVVTGTAGAARRREVGNSVAQINMARVQQPAANIDGLLQGRAAGLTVLPSSAMAGGGAMIRLRGNVSVTMSNQPLIYVDGVRVRSDAYARNVPFTGSDLRSGNDVASPLNDINPADIDRIEIIKGAAATTLYGTEAAAGVMQIFTKNGHTGRPQWTLQIDQGFARALKFGPDPSEAPPGDSIPSLYRDSFPSRFAGLPNRGVSRAGGTSSYLFIDPWLRDALRQRYSISVGGGGESLRYFVSGTMSDEDGVLPNDNESRSVMRGNFSFSPLANLIFAWNSSYTKDKISNTAAGNNAHGLTLNAFRRDRNYASNDRPEVVERMLDQEITSEIDHLITGGSVSWSPFANFTNKFTVGYDMAQIDNRNLRPFGFVSAPNGIISSRRHQYEILTFDYVGNYTFTLRDDLRSTLSWGGQSVTDERRETSAYGENFPGPGRPVVSSGGTTLGSESRQRVVNAGLFAQNVFDLKDRYFLTVGVRVDGNSAFGEDFGLQTYPKASFSWVASEEDWFPGEGTSLKLRTAVGQAGRAPGAFDAVRTWDPVGWGGQPAFYPRNVGNPALGPERTTEIEAGFDASFLNNRVTTEVTYYNRKTDQALFNVRQVPTLGFLDSQLKNVGEMTSSGIEAMVDAVVIRTPSVEWSVGGTIYTNTGKVNSLGGATDFSIGNFGWIMEGQSIPVIRTDYCITNANEKAAPIVKSSTLDENDPNYDPCIHGPNLPTHTFGMNTSLGLPYGIRINARGEYMGGHYMYDGAANAAVSRSVRWPGCYELYRLQEAGRINEAKAIDRARCEVVAQSRSDYWIYPADFFKVRELSVSVPVPTRFIPGASSARITVAGQNFWKSVNKDFKTFDPETGNNDGFTVSRVRSILEHVPPPATFTASVRVTF